MPRKKKPLRSLAAIRRAAKKEVAAAMADCQIVVTGDEPSEQELYKKGYNAAVEELVARSKVIAKQVSDTQGRELTGEIMSHLEAVARKFQTSVQKQSEAPNMPKNNRGDVLMLPRGTRLYATGQPSSSGGSRRRRSSRRNSRSSGYESVGPVEGLIVIEEEPQLRTIMVARSSYRISLPYVTFAIQYVEQPGFPAKENIVFSRVYVAFRKEPLKKIDDGGFYYAALPNCNDFGVCMGLQSTNHFGNVADLCKAVIDTFWQSTFGFDDAPVPKEFYASIKGKRTNINTFKQWEKLTRNDPTSILTAEFHSGTFRLGEMVRRFANQGANHIVARAIGDIMPLSDPENVQKLIEQAAAKVISNHLMED